jgi:hypothetical protein
MSDIEAVCRGIVRDLETWQEDNRSISMTLLKEIKRERLKAAACGSGSPSGRLHRTAATLLQNLTYVTGSVGRGNDCPVRYQDPVTSAFLYR